jgi:hypothetical protein
VSKALKFGCNTLEHRQFQIYSLSLKLSVYSIVPETKFSSLGNRCHLHIPPVAIYLSMSHLIRATPHTSQEPWPWNCESPKESVQGRPNTPPKSCSVVTDPQVQYEAICDRALNQRCFNEFLSCGSPQLIKKNKLPFVSIRSAMVSQFCVRSTFKRWFLKIIQVTMKRDPAIWCYVEFHVNFTSILHSHTLLVPQV